MNRNFVLLLCLATTCFFPIIANADDSNVSDLTEDAFTTIYQEGVWGVLSDGSGSSGEGSLPNNTIQYMEFLQGFMNTHNIRSIVDAGCGAWEFSQHMDWDGIDYLGIDVVKKVVDKNIDEFSKDNIHFMQGNFVNMDLPKADLIVCKDVLQHLPKEDILKFIKQLKKYKYCIITNDKKMDASVNEREELNHLEIEKGAYRPIDLELEPFNLKGYSLGFFVERFDVQKTIFFFCNLGVNDG